MMLGDKDAMATIAVSDMQAAQDFYGGTLGLEQVADEGPDVITYRAGKASLLVYKSDHAGTNKATAATWTLGSDIEAVVRSLKDKGVTFEHYDFPEMRLEGDLHVMPGLKAAWFKDPDGNILALVGG